MTPVEIDYHRLQLRLRAIKDAGLWPDDLALTLTMPVLQVQGIGEWSRNLELGVCNDCKGAGVIPVEIPDPCQACDGTGRHPLGPQRWFCAKACELVETRTPGVREEMYYREDTWWIPCQQPDGLCNELREFLLHYANKHQTYTFGAPSPSWLRLAELLDESPVEVRALEALLVLEL